jgi:hypothetical protein
MRYILIASTIVVTAVAASFAASEIVFAQGQSQQVPLPPGGFKPPPAPPIKPYQPIAVTLPKPYPDPSLAAFRKQLADVVARKDRAALAKLVVAQGFFWMQDKDLADKRKSGIANLATAIDLDAKDGSGWELLNGYANDPTAEPLQDHPNVICGPAEPGIDSKAFEALLKATQTEPPDWGYPAADALEVRGVAKPDAPVIEKLGLILVRVLPDSAPPENQAQQTFLHVATPSGKSGFVSLEAMSSLGGDQMCYTKEASGWKITGYYGGSVQ